MNQLQELIKEYAEQALAELKAAELIDTEWQLYNPDYESNQEGNTPHEFIISFYKGTIGNEFFTIRFESKLADGSPENMQRVNVELVKRHILQHLHQNKPGADGIPNENSNS